MSVKSREPETQPPARQAAKIGLTGGIGSGKSTVAQMLAALGAHVVDADAIARQVLSAGSPALEEVAEAFGPGVLRPDGSLDRAALARHVFSDAGARARLEAITLPRVAREAATRLAQARDGQVAVYDVPLLVEKHMEDGFDLVVVVEADLETRLRRLEARGLDRQQALERMSHQASDAQRREVADIVLDNSAGIEALESQVRGLWNRLFVPPRA